MPGASDDEYDFDDIDDETLLAVADKVEKTYAGTQAAAPSRQASVAPMKPAARVSVAQQSNKPVQTRPVALSKKAVYDDDFPDVVPDANGSYKKWVDPKDAERATLQAELAELRATLENEKKLRRTKEGEAAQLRSKAEGTSKQHEQQLATEQARSAALQDKVAALEKAAHDEKARYQSEILFARQEHESSVRQRNLASQRPASKSRNAPSTKASPNKPKMPEKKGFQNSFSESSSRKDGPTNAPRSSPTETRPEGRSRSSAPLVNGKGKARAADLDSDHQIGDDSTLFMDQDLDVAEEDSSAVMPRSAKDSLVSFLFGHPTSPFQPATKSIQVLLDAKLGSSADPEAIQAHRQACQNLFACLSRPASTSATDVEQQDRIFLAQLILAIVNFVDVFSTNGMTGETIQALVLLRDLLFSFSKFLFHQEIMLTEHNKAIQAVFKLMVRLVRQQQVRYVAYLQKRRQTQNKSATQLGGNRQPSKSIVAISPYLWQEKEIDPTMQAVLAILCILAFRPDSVCLSNWDTTLRETGFVSVLLDGGRSVPVLQHTLGLIQLLAWQPSLFRIILAIPFVRDPAEQVLVPATVPAPGARLAFIETTAAFLQYKAGTRCENQQLQQAALAILTNIAVEHVDGIPLLGSSSSLIQRLIVKNATDASLVYEAAVEPDLSFSIESLVNAIDTSLRLLYALVLSGNSVKALAVHLAEKSASRDWFVSGVGRIACTSVPEWLEDQEVGFRLDQLAEVAHELLAEVLAPDEVDDLWTLCNDDDEEEEAMAAGEQDAEQIANQNMEDLDA